MLEAATPFPQQGSNGFVRGTAEPVRIMQCLPGAIALIKRTSDAARFAGASANRREPLANLVETEREAMGLEPEEIAGRTIRTARKSGPCAAPLCGATIVPGQKFVTGEHRARICIPCAKAGLA